MRYSVNTKDFAKQSQNIEAINALLVPLIGELGVPLWWKTKNPLINGETPKDYIMRAPVPYGSSFIFNKLREALPK